MRILKLFDTAKRATTHLKNFMETEASPSLKFRGHLPDDFFFGASMQSEPEVASSGCFPNKKFKREAPSDANGEVSVGEQKDIQVISEAPVNEIVSVGKIIPWSDSECRIEASWDYFRRLGSPKYHVAPMVDQSELPFRILCRKYGAEAAYTPMFHSRLFSEEPKYRKEFTTCPADRPLFVQFCSNDPDTILAAAKLVEHSADYVDINLGCPQRIAKRGNYGSFLMDNVPLICSMVEKLAQNIAFPVSCKIRIFPELSKTLEYARKLQEAGCSLLAVHGRTRDQKNQKLIRADWDAIRAVRQAVQIPVLANGNVRWLEDADECIKYTGVQGVLSADSLLENPALFAGFKTASSHGKPTSNSADAQELPNELPGKLTGDASEASGKVADQLLLTQEYLELCEKYPVPMRMVRGHVHKMMGPWFRVHRDVRDKLNKQQKLTIEFLKELVEEIKARNLADPSLMPDCGEAKEGQEVIMK